MEPNFESRTIDGVEYDFYHISVRQLNRLLLKVFKLAGKPLSGAAAGAQSGESESLITDMIEGLASSLDEKTVDDIIDALLSKAVCRGKGSIPKNFDKVFDGNILHMWKVIGASLEVYFGSFFEEGLELVQSKGLVTLTPEK